HHASSHHGQREHLAAPIDAAVAVPIGDDGAELRVRQEHRMQPRRTAGKSKSGQEEKWRRRDEREREADYAAGRACPTQQYPKNAHPDPLLAAGMLPPPRDALSYCYTHCLRKPL